MKAISKGSLALFSPSDARNNWPNKAFEFLSMQITGLLLLYQHTIISGLITEHDYVGCRLIMKAISKGSLAGCLVHLDAGSTNRLARQNLQIPENANSRTIPSWLFGACLFARDRLTSSCPDAILVTPLPT